MSSQTRVVQTGALPPNKVPPLEAGATNPFDSAIIKQNNLNNAQNTLAGNPKQSGGKKRYRGGAAPLSPAQTPVVQVVAAPSYAVNKDATNDINTQIAGLAVSNQNNAAFDGLTNASPGATAQIAAQQQAIYSGKGGSKSKSRKHLKKGGSWPIWGCLSGGKKSRKSRRSRRRKSRKNVKRHRR